MRTKTVLSAEDMPTILAACKKEAAAQKWDVTIAVVDDGGYLLHLERMDGAPLQSSEIATSKARTAALAKASTKALEDVVKDRPAVAQMPRRLAVQGGIPLMKDGQCIGGIGVSGVKSHEDEIVAEAGRKALLG
jgi:glc operon protein GlcG